MPQYKLSKTYMKVVSEEADRIAQNTIVAGIISKSVEGLEEAKHRILGMAALLESLGEKKAKAFCLQEMGKLQLMIKDETFRNEIWAKVEKSKDDEKQVDK